MTTRCYYWTKIERRCFDGVLKILSDSEFFVEERAVSNALVERNDFYSEFLRSKASTRKLKAMFPGFDWN